MEEQWELPQPGLAGAGITNDGTTALNPYTGEFFRLNPIDNSCDELGRPYEVNMANNQVWVPLPKAA